MKFTFVPQKPVLGNLQLFTQQYLKKAYVAQVHASVPLQQTSILKKSKGPKIHHISILIVHPEHRGELSITTNSASSDDDHAQFRNAFLPAQRGHEAPCGTFIAETQLYAPLVVDGLFRVVSFSEVPDSLLFYANVLA